MMEVLPVIDVSALLTPGKETGSTAAAIGRACRDTGFFYVANHGIHRDLELRLERESKIFFSKPVVEKMQLSMDRAGRAWRGYFQVGAELTSNSPDLKEGIYFGSELAADHPLVAAQTPLHGKNLFPDDLPALRPVVLEYMAAITKLGHSLMRGIALSLGLEPEYFHRWYTKDPLILFRIFNYPAAKTTADRTLWGVGEHSDYGVLTILKQDNSGGLEVKSRRGWIAAPPIENTFVCNIGDMLDRMTAGLYRSTPHRVRNPSGGDRLSYPLFFDPNYFAEVKAIEGIEKSADDAAERWDKSSVHTFQGTYGQYLLGKIAKVFPELKKDALD